MSCSDLCSIEVIVRFVDVGGIVDHHCLNFLFIAWKQDFLMACMNWLQDNTLKKKYFWQIGICEYVCPLSCSSFFYPLCLNTIECKKNSNFQKSICLSEQRRFCKRICLSEERRFCKRICFAVVSLLSFIVIYNQKMDIVLF